MLKRIVGLVVGTTVACSSFMAFATVNTTTTYGEKVDDVQKVSVTSVVSDVTVGNTLTYLATVQGAELAGLTGDDIVYIDQVTLTEGMDGLVASTYSFNYTANADEAIQANVKVGGSVSASGTITGPACAVSVDSNAAVDYAYPANATGFTLISVSDVAQIKNVTLNGNPTIVGTDWYLGTEGIYVLNSYLMSEELAIVIEKDTEVADSVSTDGIATVGNGTAVIIVGTVTGNGEYGAKITIDDEELTYPALGKGTDGRFAIKLTGLEVGTKVVAKTYCGEVVGKQCVVTTDEINQVGSIVQ